MIGHETDSNWRSVAVSFTLTAIVVGGGLVFAFA